MPAVTLTNLDDLTLTVYLPEDHYKKISLGDQAIISVNSFPGETFNATVTQFAGQNEFMHRNVQTADGHHATVFGIELTVDNFLNKLKPGMPANVTFGE